MGGATDETITNMTYLIFISSDSDYLEMTVKNRKFDQAKDIARGLWSLVAGAHLLTIKERNAHGGFETVFTYQPKK
jgi:hypothetical protein